MTAKAYTAYLNRYVDHFAFRDRLHFGQTVMAIESEATGGWWVVT